MSSHARPHLSVVATSRNDDHGKNLHYRMQTFVDGFIEQCKRHKLNAELILVEWNPPSHSLPLAQALRFPRDKGNCTIRIIRVPAEVHSTLQHSDKIPLFQMIGKNVGIRRARGQYILATNIDILFSDSLIEYIKNHLSEEVLYRVDRLDVPEQLPDASAFGDILKFCDQNYFRINNKFGTFFVNKTSLLQKAEAEIIRLFSFLFNFIINLSLGKIISFVWNLSINSLVQQIYAFIKTPPPGMLSFLKFQIKKLVDRMVPRNAVFPHTNACGDFTLLSAEKWRQLKGYPEWNIFSWHLDSLLLYQAKQHGILEQDLPEKYSIYHIDHETGSGYSPEGAHILFKRLRDKGIPYLSDHDLNHHIHEMKKTKGKVIYNSDDWGMAVLPLEEFVVI